MGDRAWLLAAVGTPAASLPRHCRCPTEQVHKAGDTELGAQTAPQGHLYEPDAHALAHASALRRESRTPP